MAPITGMVTRMMGTIMIMTTNTATAPIMGAAITTIITMAEAPTSALLRLMTWLSPAFPVGAFAYSHGLERAIEERLVRDRVSLIGWLQVLLEHGSAWND